MKDNRKVKCPECGAVMGYQGFSRHMHFKHGVKGRIPDMRTAKIVPGEHPVEKLEVFVHSLIQQEINLADKLSEYKEVQKELDSVMALRTGLEKLVETYRHRKEVLTGVSA